MTEESLEFLETDIEDKEIASYSKRFRDDLRAHETIAGLRRLGMNEREIVIAFRLIVRIPSEWEIEKEPQGTSEKRRASLAEKLLNIAGEVENDPDLKGLCFGTNTICFGSPDPESEGFISLASCLKEGAAELQTQSSSDAPERATALKKFTINTIFDLINNPKKRAPNKEIATLTSILLGEEVSANDVSQVRKKVRRRNYRD